jgi:hypothetical protein
MAIEYIGPALTLCLVVVSSISLIRMENRHKSEVRTQLLNEIFGWASDAAQTAISRHTRDSEELWRTRLHYKYLLAQSRYIVRLTSLSFRGLTPFVLDVIRELEDGMKRIQLTLESTESGDILAESENKLRETVEKLIERIAETKVNR